MQAHCPHPLIHRSLKGRCRPGNVFDPKLIDVEPTQESTRDGKRSAMKYKTIEARLRFNLVCPGVSRVCRMSQASYKGSDHVIDPPIGREVTNFAQCIDRDDGRSNISQHLELKEIHGTSRIFFLYHRWFLSSLLDWDIRNKVKLYAWKQ